MPDTAKLIDKLSAQLPAGARALFDAVCDHATRRDLRAFLVGGTVRDLLLDRASLDVDIVIEGDAISLAREVASSTGARLAKTTVFGTAALTVALDSLVGAHLQVARNAAAKKHAAPSATTFHLDLATARAETYTRPGALPKVSPSTIDADLLRRDFTLNAIALQLNGAAPGKLLDPTGGEADLRAGLVRVLHDQSFQNDATRILRAVRNETRFGFRLEEGTLDLLRRDLSHIGTISGARIRHELQRTLDEADPERPLSRLEKLGVLHAIHPVLAFTAEQAAAFHRLPNSAPPLAAWPLLCWTASAQQLPDLIRRLALTRTQVTAVRAIPAIRDVEPQLRTAIRPSEVVDLLSPLPLATVCAFVAMAGSAPAGQQAERYLTRWRTVRPILRGDDLIKLGVPRGPEIAEVLRELQAARLDGELKSRAGEERFVEAYLARELTGFD
jgi:tRNA nucleotidyltransferase (CCA-adding enzyme)